MENSEYDMNMQEEGFIKDVSVSDSVESPCCSPTYSQKTTSISKDGVEMTPEHIIRDLLNRHHIYMGKLSANLTKFLVHELYEHCYLKPDQIELITKRITKQVVKEVKNCSATPETQYDFDAEVEEADEEVSL